MLQTIIHFTLSLIKKKLRFEFNYNRVIIKKISVISHFCIKKHKNQDIINLCRY